MLKTLPEVKMLESGISNITMFFVIVGVAVIFIVVWIIKSELRVTVAKDQIKALRSRLEAGERERYMLAEKLSAVEGAPQTAAADASDSKKEPQSKDKVLAKKKFEEALKAKEALEDENKKLKSELAEATSSLAEVYKALCEK